jgi:hypothetical protein
MSRLRAILVASVLLSSSCGGSPTAPSADAARLFRAGVYALSVTPFESVSLSSGPAMPGCPGAGSAGIHVVYSEVTLTLEGGIWHGRPLSSAAGSFDFQFVAGPVGPGAPSDDGGIAGTGSGTIISTFTPIPQAPVPDTRVMLGGGAPVTLGGGVSSGGLVAGGLVSGNVVFGNSSALQVVCSGAIPWFMSWRRSS